MRRKSSKVLLSRKPSSAPLYDIVAYSNNPSTIGDVTQATDIKRDENKSMLVNAVVSQRDNPLHDVVSKMDISPYEAVSTEDTKGKQA